MKNSDLFRILYVARNEDDHLLLSAMFDLPNLKITPADSFAEALRKSESENFDLYLLETRLPDGDGFELCKIMRQSQPHTPIVFYSGDAAEAHKAKGLAVGADAYLAKPYFETLEKTLNQFIFSGNQN